jgi:transposase
MYLPPYCPKLNPIELCLAAVKQQLQASQILNRTDDPEWEICQLAGKIMTADLGCSLYRHCGYCTPEN